MKISVIIPVYNAEKYISQAVESALQFEEVYEIILIEDKSPDNALQVRQKLAEKYAQIKLYQHPDKGNHGAGASRNIGLEKVTGDFAAFLDADHYYLPNRFDAERELFKNSEVDGVYGANGVQYYSEKANHEDVYLGLINLRGTFGLIPLDALTIRKTALSRMNKMFETYLRLHQDSEFIVRLAYYLQLYTETNDESIALRGLYEDNRITKVDSGKTNPATTRALIWRELSKWDENEESVPEGVKIHIQRMFRSFEIAIATTFKKWEMIGKHLIIDYRNIISGLYNINFRSTII